MSSGLGQAFQPRTGVRVPWVILAARCERTGCRVFMANSMVSVLVPLAASWYQFGALLLRFLLPFGSLFRHLEVCFGRHRLPKVRILQNWGITRPFAPADVPVYFFPSARPMRLLLQVRPKTKGEKATVESRFDASSDTFRRPERYFEIPAISISETMVQMRLHSTGMRRPVL